MTIVSLDIVAAQGTVPKPIKIPFLFCTREGAQSEVTLSCRMMVAKSKPFVLKDISLCQTSLSVSTFP